uniref:Uncharacterized protein n=1 Tax=viral metagenome TaxID=1070528 RepID=A0A6C0FAY4_9ZZZZ|tara:strand:- start:12314 stop:12745 length:432 start_codon:yes stop_codon:yes gene_type:complete
MQEDKPPPSESSTVEYLLKKSHNDVDEMRGTSPGSSPRTYDEQEEKLKIKKAERMAQERERQRHMSALAGQGSIQPQLPAAGRVMTPYEIANMMRIGRKILRRAAKRSSKAAVLKQLSDFGRKNKKHAKKCLFYAKCLTCDSN